METFLQAFGGIMAFAVIVQFFIRLVRSFVDPILEKVGMPDWLKVWIIVAMIMGVIAAFMFDLDIIVLLNLGDGTVFGKIVTGFFIGGGSAFVHEFLMALIDWRSKLQETNGENQ